MDASVHLDQEDKFAQFIGQVATLITNRKIVDQYFCDQSSDNGWGEEGLEIYIF